MTGKWAAVVGFLLAAVLLILLGAGRVWLVQHRSGPPDKGIRQAILLSGDYLGRACGPDSRFIYRIN